MKLSGQNVAGLSIVGLLLLSITGTALGCGESRYRLGHGIRFEAFQVPLPAQLLIYNSGDEHMTHRLQSVGHQVTVANDSAQLADALSQSSYDIVIAPYAEMGTVKQIVDSASLQADLLPLVSGGRSERRAAKEQYDKFLNSKFDLRRYARAIHRIMEARGP